MSRIWSSGDSDWTITGSGQYASKSSNGSYADVFTNLLSPGTLYGFTVDIPDGDDNGGWFFGDSNSTSLSGTHPNQGRGSNSIGMRGRTSGHSDEGEVGVHGTFASANGVSASNNALTGFESVNPEGAISIDFVVDRSSHKVWVKPSSSSNWVKGGNPTDSSSTPSFSIPSTGDIYFGFIQYDAQTNLDITQFIISQSASTDADVLRDVPTNGDSSDDSGAGGEVSGNYCTFNPLYELTGGYNIALSNGNLEAANGGDAPGTMAFRSGKKYFELTVKSASSFSQGYFGIVNIADHIRPRSWATSQIAAVRDSGSLYGDGSTGSAPAATQVGDVYGFAVDVDNQKVFISVNGTYLNSANPASGTGASFTGRDFSNYAPLASMVAGNSQTHSLPQKR